MTKACEQCGAPIAYNPHEGRRLWQQRRFCSTACANLNRRKGVAEPKTCEACGAPYERGEREGWDDWNRRRYCSPACSLARAVAAHERVLRRTERPSEDECWLWQGALTERGYGVIQLGRGRGTAKAHRVVYEALVGPIPEGMTLDHLCFNPACVNPAHLDPCSREENTRRQIAAGRTNPWGHKEE